MTGVTMVTGADAVPTVLVVDDDPDLHTILQSVLVIDDGPDLLARSRQGMAGRPAAAVTNAVTAICRAVNVPGSAMVLGKFAGIWDKR